MHMIFYASRTDRRAFDLIQNPNNVSMESRSNRSIDQWRSILRAKYKSQLQK